MDEQTAEIPNRKLTMNTIVLVPNFVKTFKRALDTMEIFITTVTDSMFEVNYPCLLNLKPVSR